MRRRRPRMDILISPSNGLRALILLGHIASKVWEHHFSRMTTITNWTLIDAFKKRETMENNDIDNMKGGSREGEGFAFRKRGIQSFWNKYWTTAPERTDDLHKRWDELTNYDYERSWVDRDVGLGWICICILDFRLGFGEFCIYLMMQSDV